MMLRTASEAREASHPAAFAELPERELNHHQTSIVNVGAPPVRHDHGVLRHVDKLQCAQPVDFDAKHTGVCLLP